jgi:hypothetical protein
VANYNAGRIRKKPHQQYSKSLEGKKERKPYVIGFDSEADTSSDGRPMCFQYSLPDMAEEDTIIQDVPATKNAGLGCFLDFLDEYCKHPGTEYLIYGWNSAYELTQLFHDLPKEVLNESDWRLNNIRGHNKTYGWIITVANEKRQIIDFRKGKVCVQLLDGTAFYKTSLDKAAKMLGVGEKYALPGIDRSLFTRRDLLDEKFIRYAKRDAFVTRLIGEYIQRQHSQFGIRTCISAPHFAATVFKTHFLSTSLVCPDSAIEQAGLYSYHGGKNGYYLDGPASFPVIYNYDITSAYPEAMKQLPDIEHATWKATNKYTPGVHALYLATLQYRKCKYGGIQDHDGHWANSGRIQCWTTSYELDAVLQQKEAKLLGCTGFLFQGPMGGALSKYVDEFFAIKSTTTGPERETAKLLLNSLYGKFFQKQSIGSVGNYDLDTESWIVSDGNNQSYDYEAGGLYNPPVASLITGYVRAKIHNLEHKYESVMTSTDGLFGLNPPDGNDVGKSLGKLTAERGSLRSWRERLYVFDSIDGKQKFALHGFHGHLSCGKADCFIGHLADIPLAAGEYRYFGQQMITLKMSTRDHRAERYSPGQFVKMQFTLRLG